MLAYVVLRTSLIVSLGTLAACPAAGAAEPTPGQVLTDLIGLAQTYDVGEEVCMEMAKQVDVEKQVANTPDLLGGIKPTDPEWVEARALYVKLYQSGCRHDKAAAAEAFARALDESQSVADLEALIALFRSDLGVKLREASLVANSAAYRATMQTGTSEDAYDAFGEGIAELVTKRKPSPAPESIPKSVRALPDASTAVALSDTIVKAIVAGRAEEALETAKPYSSAPDAQFNAMIEQVKQQWSGVASRFGGSLDYELVRNDTIGDSLTRTVFMHRFERGAIIWLFSWYRGTDGWVLINLRFADDATLLFR